MMQPINLQSLEPQEDDSATIFVSRGKLGALKSSLYQTGFKAGQIEADTRHDNQQSHIMLELSRKLQDINFTHVEARQNVIRALKPLLQQMVKTVLPVIATEALSDIVSAHITALAKQCTAGNVKIMCAADDAETLSRLLLSLRHLPFSTDVIVDPDCLPRQIVISAPDSEQQINLAEAVRAVSEGVTEFYKSTTEEKNHG